MPHTISNKIARKDISSDESLQQGRNRSRELGDMVSSPDNTHLSGSQKEGANRSHGGAIGRPSVGLRADASAAACGPAAQEAAVTSPWEGSPIEGALA